MNKYALPILITVLFSHLGFSQETDSIQSKDIEEVQISKKSTIEIKRKNDKYFIDVMGTEFQDQSNSWEALKTIPILRVDDNSGIFVFNKKVRLEINGVLAQIPMSDIENYIKSINPKDIKSIEVTSVPNASYASDVEAVININLYSKIDSYRIGLTYNTGFRKKFFAVPGISANLNYKRFRGYINYSASFYQPIQFSELEYNLNDFNEKINAVNRRKLNSHNLISNFEWDLSQKSKIVLMQDLMFSDNQSTIENAIVNEESKMETKRKVLKLSQILYHNFNERNEIKFGVQEILPETKFQNITYDQKVNTEVPIFNYFVDYTNKNKLGETLVGVKLSTITSESFNQNTASTDIFKYKESTQSSYLNQSIAIGENKNISAGIRYESTHTEANTKTQSVFERNFENLLYNISYNSTNYKKQKGSTISFKKSIQKPNYNYLNIYAVNNDIVGFVGDEDIVPTKFYAVGFEHFNKKWFYSLQTGYVQDFLSTFYTSENNSILNTYKNFDKAIVGTIVGGYSNTLFKVWNINYSAEGTYFKLKDEQYNSILKNSTPRLSLNLNNRLQLNKSTSFSFNYSLVSNYNDGLIKHYSTNKLNLIFTKRFKNLDAILYYYDVFKGMDERELIDNSMFVINSSSYMDNRVLGLSLRWNLASKNFKTQKTEEIEDESIDRL